LSLYSSSISKQKNKNNKHSHKQPTCVYYKLTYPIFSPILYFHDTFAIPTNIHAFYLIEQTVCHIEQYVFLFSKTLNLVLLKH